MKSNVHTRSARLQHASHGRGSTRWLLQAAVAVLSVLGLAFSMTAPASAAPARPVVWVGSPVAGTWPDASGCAGATAPSSACSLPSVHHTYFYGMPEKGDFGIDIGVGAGTAVKVYAAPQQTSRVVTAKVDNISLTCGIRAGESSESARKRGGNTVVVGFYTGNQRVGWASYAHVNPTVSKGQSINRWGGTVGTVGRYTPNTCWTGVHLHMELTNEANYACYNRGWKPGQKLNPSNFVGFLGGAYATSRYRACP